MAITTMAETSITKQQHEDLRGRKVLVTIMSKLHPAMIVGSNERELLFVYTEELVCEWANIDQYVVHLLPMPRRAGQSDISEGDLVLALHDHRRRKALVVKEVTEGDEKKVVLFFTKKKTITKEPVKPAKPWIMVKERTSFPIDELNLQTDCTSPLRIVQKQKHHKLPLEDSTTNVKISSQPVGQTRQSSKVRRVNHRMLHSLQGLSKKERGRLRKRKKLEGESQVMKAEIALQQMRLE